MEFAEKSAPTGQSHVAERREEATATRQSDDNPDVETAAPRVFEVAPDYAHGRTKSGCER